MKTGIINGDDFGLTPGVNLGILDTYLAGCLSSTTLLVNAAETEHAAGIAREHPGLGVGLHFNLTLGKPILDVQKIPTLVDAHGLFYGRVRLARRLFLGQVRREHIALELQAQFERMQDLGLQPTHVDSHQHVHGFPPVFDAVASLCQERKLPMRMLWHIELPGRAPSLGRRLRLGVLDHMLSRNRARWSEKVRWNTGLGSVFDLGYTPHDIGLEHYQTILGGIQDGVFELMVHPVRDAKEVEGLTRIGLVGEAEWKFLKTGQLREAVVAAGFTLRNFQEAL